MKKLICLVIALCLLCTAAFAENAVLQNGAAPELVCMTDASGNAYCAVIFDAEGNEVAKVAEDMIVCEDVSARDAAENAQALQAAFAGVNADVHFSDVKSAVSEGTLKADLNSAMTDGTAYDLVMSEMFAIALSGEYAQTAAVEGNTVEITFALEEGQNVPAFVVASEDGEAWSIVENVVVNADNTVTVRFDALGVAAFLFNNVPFYAAQNVVVVTEEETEGEAEEALSVGQTVAAQFNSNFTPSVSGKAAPELLLAGAVSGEILPEGEFVAAIISKTEQIVSYVPNDNHLIVTPFSERAFAADLLTFEGLEWAYNAIISAETLADLSAAGETGIGAAVDAVLEGTGLTCENLVVRDLFEISAYGDYVEKLYDADACVQMTFGVSLYENDALVVLVSADSATWTVVPAEDVVINNDGSVTVRLSELGVVAFMVEAEAEIAEEVVTSPAT